MTIYGISFSKYMAYETLEEFKDIQNKMWEY